MHGGEEYVYIYIYMATKIQCTHTDTQTHTHTHTVVSEGRVAVNLSDSFPGSTVLTLSRTLHCSLLCQPANQTAMLCSYSPSYSHAHQHIMGVRELVTRSWTNSLNSHALSHAGTVNNALQSNEIDSQPITRTPPPSNLCVNNNK